MANVDNFRKVPVKIPYKSGFDKSFRNTLTGTTGTLIPVFVDELIPNSDVFLRMPFVLGMPPLATDTFMNVNYKLEAFFVPTRLIMKGFERFVNGDTTIKNASGNDVKIRVPLVTCVSDDYPYFAPGTLLDYLGFRSEFEQGYDDSLVINALPLLCYGLIYDEWYRNSLVQESLYEDSLTTSYYPYSIKSVVPTDDSDSYILSLEDQYNNGSMLFELFQRNFGADYFTVGTLRPQNGQSIGVNLTLNADNIKQIVTKGFKVANDGTAIEAFSSYPSASVQDALRHGIQNRETERWSDSKPQSDKDKSVWNGSTAGSVNVNQEFYGSKTGGFTIASLRAANSLQQFLERNNIAGNRFVDFLRANYGADLADGVAQRPVYLGSSSTPIYVSGVLQTANGAEVSGNNPFSSVGSSYGRALAQDKDFVVKFHCDEPGYLMVIGSLVPEVSYASGVERMLRRYVLPDSRTDMANHLLQNVGPQPIYKSELNTFLGSVDASSVFAYVDRYADWMTRNNQIHGLLRDGESLEAFALQRRVDTQDGLTSNFLTIPKNYLDQVMAVTEANSGYSYWVDFYCDYKVSMPLAKYSIPSLQDPAYEHGDTVWMNRGGVRLD